VRIAYVLPSLYCCGGHRIALEHLVRLSARGHQTAAVVLDPKRYVLDWFPHPEGAFQIIDFWGDPNWVNEFDCVVATFNETAWDVLNLSDHLAKFYFVQTDERFFYEAYPEGYRRCEASYQLRELSIITIANWIKHWLEDTYGRSSVLVPNKINFDHFHPDPRIPKDRFTVLVEGNAHAKKKGVHEAARAIEDLPCEKWLLTNSDPPLPDYVRVFDRVFNKPPPDEVRQVYSSADVLLKPSHHEGSPLPHIEAMACKTAVITTNCCGANEYCHPELNCLMVPVGGVYEMRSAVIRLMSDEPMRRRLVDQAWDFAQRHLQWSDSIDLLERAFRDGLETHHAPRGRVTITTGPRDGDRATSTKSGASSGNGQSNAAVNNARLDEVLDALNQTATRLPQVRFETTRCDGEGPLDVVGAIRGGVVMRQRIRSAGADLCGFRVQVATYCRKVDSHLFWRVLTQGGECLWESLVPGAQLQDNGWLQLVMPPITDSCGESFVLEVSLPEPSPEDAVTLYCRKGDPYSEGTLTVGDQTIDGSLCLELLHFKGNASLDTLLSLAGAGRVVRARLADQHAKMSAIIREQQTQITTMENTRGWKALLAFRRLRDRALRIGK